MKSKRQKINFDSVNGGNYTIIPQKDIAETNARISKSMKEFKKNINRKKKCPHPTMIFVGGNKYGSRTEMCTECNTILNG